MLQEGRDDLPSLLFALLSGRQAGIISLDAEDGDTGRLCGLPPPGRLRGGAEDLARPAIRAAV